MKKEYDDQEPVIFDSNSYEDNSKEALREKLKEKFKLKFDL